MKVEYVKLRPHDLEQLITAFQSVVDYKHQSLTKINWQRFEQEYLPKMIDALRENNFKISDPHNNILTWTLDQIIHSKKVLDGVPKSDWIPLADLASFEKTLSMLRAASRGAQSYKTWCASSSTYNNLFD